MSITGDPLAGSSGTKEEGACKCGLPECPFSGYSLAELLTVYAVVARAPRSATHGGYANTSPADVGSPFGQSTFEGAIYAPVSDDDARNRQTFDPYAGAADQVTSPLIASASKFPLRLGVAVMVAIFFTYLAYLAVS